ncbi:Reep5 [Symbiodinium sp. KB8]|nr:Reep5 [Symbiodinium sp. KB8]
MSGILALLSFIFFGFGANFLTNAIGFTWPAYRTFKAIESDDLKDDAFWLKYWVCFGVLTIADGALSFVLWWMPFYYLVKAGVVLYLMLDATRGAEVAYDFLVKPLLLKYQDFIDDSVVKATEAFTRAAGPEVEPELAPAADEWQAVEEMDNAVGDMAKED